MHLSAANQKSRAGKVPSWMAQNIICAGDSCVPSVPKQWFEQRSVRPMIAGQNGWTSCLVDCFCTGRPIALLGSPPQVWKKHLSCDRPYPYFVIDLTSRSFDSDSSSNPLFTRLLRILSRVWIALEHLLPFSPWLAVGSCVLDLSGPRVSFIVTVTHKLEQLFLDRMGRLDLFSLWLDHVFGGKPSFSLPPLLFCQLPRLPFFSRGLCDSEFAMRVYLREPRCVGFEAVGEHLCAFIVASEISSCPFSLAHSASRTVLCFLRLASSSCSAFRFPLNSFNWRRNLRLPHLARLVLKVRFHPGAATARTLARSHAPPSSCVGAADAPCSRPSAALSVTTSRFHLSLQLCAWVISMVSLQLPSSWYS